MLAKTRSMARVRRRKGKGLATPTAVLNTSRFIVKSRKVSEIPIRIASNPSIVLRNGYAELFIRCASIGSDFDHTFIAVTERIPIDRVAGINSIAARAVLHPYLSFENVEDPRIGAEDSAMLYHVRIYAEPRNVVLTFRAHLSNDGAGQNEPLVFEGVDGSLCMLRDYRDTFRFRGTISLSDPILGSVG